MNRWIKLTIPLAAAVALLALAGCEGPAGPAGTASCMNCHTDNYTMADYLLPMETEYAVSRHATGETFVRRGSASDPSCSRCHTTEGFQQYVETGTPVAVTSSSHIGCFACHAPHTNSDFRQRKQSAVTLDLGGGTYDKGTSNTCAVCHQARVLSPAIVSADTIKSSRWGPHHGPQANVMSGNTAYVFTGSQPYPANAAHNGIADGCVTCHMAETAANGLAGDHTFTMAFEYHSTEYLNSKGCVTTGCHGTWDDTKALKAVDDAKAAFQLRLDSLADLLIARGWLKSDKTTVVTGAAAARSGDERGALFNYFLVTNDHSGGVHNVVYTDAVVTASINYLKSLSIAQH